MLMKNKTEKSYFILQFQYSTKITKTGSEGNYYFFISENVKFSLRHIKEIISYHNNSLCTRHISSQFLLRRQYISCKFQNRNRLPQSLRPGQFYWNRPLVHLKICWSENINVFIIIQKISLLTEYWSRDRIYTSYFH